MEPNEIPINGNGRTTFIWAHGHGNDFSGHADRGAFDIWLHPCNADYDTVEGAVDSSVIATPATNRSLWTAHGVFAGIAWGVLVPLAISSSLLRDLFQNRRLWFKIHISLNMTAAIFTIVAFLLAVVGQHNSAKEGEPVTHFAIVAHRTVGLVITIFVFCQVVFGLMRPRPPRKISPDEERVTAEPRKKTKVRIAWEISHKVLGVAMLCVAWWQVQDGLSIYAARFGLAHDYNGLFWFVVTIILSVTLVLYMYSKFIRKRMVVPSIIR